MKLKGSLMIVVVSLLSSSAFAHAYRTEVCKSGSHELIYKGNYPVGGDYGIKLLGEEEDVLSLPVFNGSETENTLEDAEVIFNENSTKVLSQSAPTSDCGFEHSERLSEKEIEIKLITKEASKRLNLKSGEKIIFSCEETFDFPDNSECKE